MAKSGQRGTGRGLIEENSILLMSSTINLKSEFDRHQWKRPYA
ncbi:hypothetical protein BAE44_0011406 [Dichanthelium oligosanthes]|uniref:Uncharacterized protein n=1 Tax=Dichanthelium oligosanthes TaxID=888268 RepID=A0A1E5VR17_9POAL|nr:hypothetical protein BAE44_0011406 [Dichanthelium oligosanthes]